MKYIYSLYIYSWKLKRKPEKRKSYAWKGAEVERATGGRPAVLEESTTDPLNGMVFPRVGGWPWDRKWRWACFGEATKEQNQQMRQAPLPSRWVWQKSWWQEAANLRQKIELPGLLGKGAHQPQAGSQAGLTSSSHCWGAREMHPRALGSRIPWRETVTCWIRFVQKKQQPQKQGDLRTLGTSICPSQKICLKVEHAEFADVSKGIQQRRSCDQGQKLSVERI